MSTITKQIAHNFNALTATLASTTRGWQGLYGSQKTTQPEKLLELYDMEASPYCRLVREALTELDIDVLIYPCPKGGTRFRPRAEKIGGKQQFPLLVDPNTDLHLYESADIIQYLYNTYSHRPAPQQAQLMRQINVATSYAATAFRIGLNGMPAGMKANTSSKTPEQPLELYSFESSPYSKAVREHLCELEIPFITRQFGKSSGADMGPPWVRQKLYPNKPVEGRNRIKMMNETGRMQVPYLIDPNTDTAMFESQDIINYLHAEYG